MHGTADIIEYLVASRLVQKEWNGFIHMLRVFLRLARRQGCSGLLSLSAHPSLSFLYQDHWLAEEKHIQLSETQTPKLSESLGWNTELVIYLLCCFSLGVSSLHGPDSKGGQSSLLRSEVPFPVFWPQMSSIVWSLSSALFNLYFVSLHASKNFFLFLLQGRMW